VESEEDAKWKSQLLNDHPWLVAKEFNLNRRLLNFLNFKGINNPDSQVADQ